MIALLILFILIVIFLACFIGFNLNNICASLWLFKNFTNINVAILVLVSFGAGIVFSLLLYIIVKFKSSLKNSEVESEVQKRVSKSVKREKTEAKLKKLQEKRNKKSAKNNASENSSDATIVADKPL